MLPVWLPVRFVLLAQRTAKPERVYYLIAIHALLEGMPQKVLQHVPHVLLVDLVTQQVCPLATATHALVVPSLRQVQLVVLPAQYVEIVALDTTAL